MLIPISEEFELESNGQCYWVNRYIVTKKGPNTGKRYKRGEAYCGYHRTLREVLDSFTQCRIREADVTELKALSEKIDAVSEEIRRFCDRIEMLS